VDAADSCTRRGTSEDRVLVATPPGRARRSFDDAELMSMKRYL
jgi:hypothetical protein